MKKALNLVLPKDLVKNLYYLIYVTHGAFIASAIEWMVLEAIICNS